MDYKMEKTLEELRGCGFREIPYTIEYINDRHVDPRPFLRDNGWAPKANKKEGEGEIWRLGNTTQVVNISENALYFFVQPYEHVNINTLSAEENEIIRCCMELAEKRIPLKIKESCCIINALGEGLCASCDKFWTDDGDMTRMIDIESAEALFKEFPTVFKGCHIHRYGQKDCQEVVK